MPYHPPAPQRRRPSSGIEPTQTPTSPNSAPFTPIRSSHSRRSSVQSLRTTTSPRPPSSHDRTGGLDFSTDSAGPTNAGNGLGSLADELAEAWDEDGEGEEDTSSMQAEDEKACDGTAEALASPPYDYQFDMEIIGLAISPPLLQTRSGSQKHLRQISHSKHGHGEADYSGLDYADESEFGDSGIPPALETRMTVIEALARQGAASSTAEVNGVFGRVADSLRDLTSQASIENHTTRLTTAHTAFTSHLMHQTRLIQSLTHPLLSPLFTPPAAETIDPLLPLLTSLILSLPQPPSTALPSLHGLHSSTTDLLSTLTYLSDTLYMTRQTTTLAARRLRAAKEAVEILKRELKEAEEGVRWLETGGWDDRLRGREAAKMCGEVVGGFEEVCAEWREMLVRQGAVEVGTG
ncbi:hypothetical protein MMC13_006181 [Lambiella insularis]|nr:hypothetical protein [Lambiella insularis]